MREEYIKKVKKELAVSRKQKHEVIRDLNEAFDSAAEHEETEKQVVDRLGTPKDFAENIEETIGFDRAQYRKRTKKFIAVCCSCGIAIFCLVAALILGNPGFPDDAIGQADAMTTITVSGSFPFDIFSVLLIAGFAFVVDTAVLAVGLVRKNK